MKNNMFFVIPEMPSKTFVMIDKKLPDHFKKGKCRKKLSHYYASTPIEISLALILP
mgnify:CR=1 FL=1